MLTVPCFQIDSFYETAEGSLRSSDIPVITHLPQDETLYDHPTGARAQDFSSIQRDGSNEQDVGALEHDHMQDEPSMPGGRVHLRNVSHVNICCLFMGSLG